MTAVTISQHSLSRWPTFCFSVAGGGLFAVVSDSCDGMDYSPPGSSVHGIFQARTLEWVAISFFIWLFYLPIIKALSCNMPTWRFQIILVKWIYVKPKQSLFSRFILWMPFQISSGAVNCLLQKDDISMVGFFWN